MKPTLLHCLVTIGRVVMGFASNRMNEKGAKGMVKGSRGAKVQTTRTICTN